MEKIDMKFLLHSIPDLHLEITNRKKPFGFKVIYDDKNGSVLTLFDVKPSIFKEYEYMYYEIMSPFGCLSNSLDEIMCHISFRIGTSIELRSVQSEVIANSIIELLENNEEK